MIEQMPGPAILVEHLSKRHYIGSQPRYRTLRETLVETATSPLRMFRGVGRRDEIWALDDVSFEVPKGAVVGIVGSNGAGKSTLLKVLAGITPPTKGRATIRGRIASLLEVGTGFHPELTGAENIYLNGAILGMHRHEIQRAFAAIVAFAEVEKFLHTPVKHYSSGMYVRLAFAVAAHLEPEILIVDEVLAVGDAQFQKKCLGKIKSVATGEGRTVLLVSHQLATITSLCARGIWLDQGAVRFIGRADEAVRGYLDQFTPEHSLVLDLARMPRDPRSSNKLRLTRLELNAGAPIVNREPFSAVLHFECLAPVTNVSFGLGFTTLEGTRLMTIDSDYHGRRRDLPAGHRGSVELRIPQMTLGPGNYGLDVGARAGEIDTLDYLPACGVIDVNARAGVPAGFSILGGGVRVEAEWQWKDGA